MTDLQPHIPLRFELRRNETAHAYDTVATGVQFSDGTVVIRWLGEHPSTQTYSDWGHAMRIHHIGGPMSDRWTTAVWMDGICFACGADLNRVAVHSGGNGTQCCACSCGWEGPPNRRMDEHPTTWKSTELPAKETP